MISHLLLHEKKSTFRRVFHSINENTLIRGCQNKEGAEMLNGKSYDNGRFTLMGGTLMSGLTVIPPIQQRTEALKSLYSVEPYTTTDYR